MPALGVGEERDAAALLGARDDQRRPLVGERVAVGAVDGCDVVAVDLDRAPPERLRPVAEHVGLPAVHRRSALAEPVEVQDRGHVAGAVEGRRLHRLPDGALGHLRVAEQDPHVGVGAVESKRERHPESDREALAERAGGHVDPREALGRRGMTLQGGSVGAKRQEQFVVERAGRLQHGVERR